MIGNARSENKKFTLETWVKITKVLEYKIRQASLLMRPNFVIFEGFETHLDTSRVRFGLALSVRAPLFYLQKSLNALEK